MITRFESSYQRWLCKIKSVNPKGNQSWIFIGRTDAEAETLILWPPDAKNWLIGKDPDAGRDWRQEEKGTTEDEKVGWHHLLDGHEFEQVPGAGDGQGGLVCCSPWVRKVSDRTEQLNWPEPEVTPASFPKRSNLNCTPPHVNASSLGALFIPVALLPAAFWLLLHTSVPTKHLIVLIRMPWVHCLLPEDFLSSLITCSAIILPLVHTKLRLSLEVASTSIFTLTFFRLYEVSVLLV